MRLFRLFPLLVFCLFVRSLLAQSALEGLVTDPGGAAVGGATVTLQSRERRLPLSTRTEADGAFRFPEVAPGDYLLRVASPEFAVAVRTIRVAETPAERIEVSLALAAVSEHVVVTAAGGPQMEQEVAQAAASLTAAELEARQKNLLADALWAMPGLRVQRIAGPGSFTKLVFRGLRTTNTSLLIDGLPVRDVAGFRGDLASFFSELNPNNVSAIEVVRGPGSVFYGSAASGGMINFVPRESAEGPRLEFGYEGGSLSQAIGRFSAAGTAGERFGYSAGVVRTDVNAGEDGNDIWRNTNVSGNARYRLRPDMNLSGNFFLSDTPRLNLNLSPFPIGPAGNELGFETGAGPVVGFISNLDDPDDYRVSRILPVSGRFDHAVAGAYSYTVAYRAMFSRRNFPAGPGQHPLATRLGVFPSVADVSRFDGDDHLAETRHTVSLGGAGLLNAGYKYERQSATQEFVSGDFRSGPTTDRQSSHAVFLHYQLAALQRRLQVGAGGRVEAFRVQNPESVPELRGLRVPSAKTGDLSVAYFIPRTGTKVRAHGGNAFREPSLGERFQVLTISGERVRVGNPLIEPERSVVVDGGIDQFLWNERIQLGATYFYHRLQSLIQSRTLFRQTNVRGGLSRGAEVEVRARPLRHLGLRAAYTYTNSDFIPGVTVPRVDGSVAPSGVARPLESIPGHTYSFAATAARGRWDGFFDVAGISSFETPLFSPVRFTQVLMRFDGYARANIGAGYTHALSERWNMRWFGRVENVFNKLYFEDGFRSPRAVGIAGVRFSY
jgi:vitamin B12 transporter